MRRISRLQQPLGSLYAQAESTRPGPATAGRLLTTCRQRNRPCHATLSTTSRNTRTNANARRLYTPSVNSRCFSTSMGRRKAENEKADTATVAPETEADAVAEAEAVPELEAQIDADAAQWGQEPELVIPGEYETAPRPGQVTDSTYVPAISGDRLEEVGGLDGWWEDNRHWDPSVEFRGFGPAARVTDPAILEVLARRAVLEALAVRSAQGGADTTGLTDAWSRGGPSEMRAALDLQVEVAADGSVLGVQGDVSAVVAGLGGDAVPSAAGELGVEEPYIDADEARELVGSWDAGWKAVSLADPALKFAVTKRILQLTGHILPDAQAASAQTVGALVSVLVRPPKPKKLAEELAADGTLANLPNVSVYGRRVTPIDKHKMVGRWKVIVQELEKRGLPVTGTGGHGKYVEQKWVYR